MQDSASSARRPVIWRAALFPQGQTHFIPARTREISLTSISLLAEQPLPDKTPCRILLEIPAEDRRHCEYLEIHAAVSYTTLVGGGSSNYRIGLRLHDLPRSVQDRLREFMT